MVETMTWLLELVRHRISTIPGVKICNTAIPYGSMYRHNKSQTRICSFCRAEQNSHLWGPLSSGTENEGGWELSSQILWLTSQYIIFTKHTHTHSHWSIVALKLSRFFQSYASQQLLLFTQYISTWCQQLRTTSHQPLTLSTLCNKITYWNKRVWKVKTWELQASLKLRSSRPQMVLFRTNHQLLLQLVLLLEPGSWVFQLCCWIFPMWATISITGKQVCKPREVSTPTALALHLMEILQKDVR